MLEHLDFQPDFSKGLLPVVVQDVHTLEVLMVAYMNQEAFTLSLQTGEAHYFSRSRQKIWHKGETSKHIQKIIKMRLDCDNDTLLLLVEQIGGASCHTGHRSCFYRELVNGQVSICAPKVFDPQTVYHNT